MTAATAHDSSPGEAEVLLEGFLKLGTPEGFRAELIEGEIVVSPPPGGTHEADIWSIVRQVTEQSATKMAFSGNKGLLLDRGGPCPKNHVIPDGVFVPSRRGSFYDADPWMRCGGVALVVEVTSDRPDRDRMAKRQCYATAGVPLYLLVDREQQTVTLFSEPKDDPGDYLEDVRVAFGHPLQLPEPFAFTLDTSELR
jgi:Uma2 family endonuclease